MKSAVMGRVDSAIAWLKQGSRRRASAVPREPVTQVATLDTSAHISNRSDESQESQESRSTQKTKTKRKTTLAGPINHGRRLLAARGLTKSKKRTGVESEGRLPNSSLDSGSAKPTLAAPSQRSAAYGNLLHRKIAGKLGKRSTRPTRSTARLPSVSAAQSPDPRRFGLWIKEGCPFCMKALDLLDQKGAKYQIRPGGLQGYMQSDEFRTLLSMWNSDDAKSTPFRGMYPTIVEYASDSAPVDNAVRLVGGYHELLNDL